MFSMFGANMKLQKTVLFNRDGKKPAKFRLKPFFRNVAAAAALLKDHEVSQEGRINAALFLLLGRLSYMRARLLSREDRVKLLGMIFEVLNPSCGDKKTTAEDSEKRASGETGVSLEKDSELIYGGFLQAYGINLRKAKLDWREFSALLSCIPESTALFSVMKIRAMEIPPGATPEQEQKIYALKRRFSLGGGAGDNCGGYGYEEQLEKLFEKLV